MGIGVLDIPLSDISLKLDHVGGEAFPFPSDLHPITIALTGSGNVPGGNTDTDTETVSYSYQLTNFSHQSFSIF